MISKSVFGRKLTHFLLSKTTTKGFSLLISLKKNNFCRVEKKSMWTGYIFVKGAVTGVVKGVIASVGRGIVERA